MEEREDFGEILGRDKKGRLWGEGEERVRAENEKAIAKVNLREREGLLVIVAAAI